MMFLQASCTGYILSPNNTFQAEGTAPFRLRCCAGGVRALEQQGASLLAAEHAAYGQLAAHCMAPVSRSSSLLCPP